MWFKSEFIGRLRRYLITGFLVVAPISITIFLLLWFVSVVDHLLGPVVFTMVGRHIPGFGLMTAAMLLMAVGFLSSNILGQQVLNLLEELILRIPVFNWLYRTVKQLTEVFSPGGAMQFKSVVMVEYPRQGVYQLGFVTHRAKVERLDGVNELLAVYIPTNHLYIGDIVLVPPKSIRKTVMSLQDGIQYYLSAGASLPDNIIKEIDPDSAG